MPAGAQRLTWRFGERAIAVEAVRDGMTWCLTARGKREDLVERDFDFTKAAARLRARIEAKLQAARR